MGPSYEVPGTMHWGPPWCQSLRRAALEPSISGAVWDKASCWVVGRKVRVGGLGHSYATYVLSFDPAKLVTPHAATTMSIRPATVVGLMHPALALQSSTCTAAKNLFQRLPIEP